MADATADGTSSGATDPPSTQRRPSRLRMIVAAFIVVAVFIGATVLAAGDDAFQFFDSGPRSCGVETPAGSIESAAPAGMRQTLSPEPALQWTQIDPPVDQFYRTRMRDDGTLWRTNLVSAFMTAPDGLVFVRVNDGGRRRLLVTSNGTDWEELALPPNVQPQHIGVSGNRWVIAGRALGDEVGDENRFDLDRVVVSDDRGATWTEVPIDPQTPPLFRDKHIATVDLMVSGNRIVLMSVVRPEMQVRDPFVEHGLAEPGDDVVFGGFREDTVMALVRSSDAEGNYVHVELSLEDLDLADREKEIIGRWEHIDANHLGYIRLYAGDQYGLEVASELNSGSAHGVATRDGFVVAVDRDEPGGWRYLASPDAREWGELYPASPNFGFPLSGIDANGEAWAVLSEVHFRNVLTKMRCGQAPTPVATLDGIQFSHVSGPGIHAGRAGFAAVAEPVEEFRLLFGIDPVNAVGSPFGTVAKGIYELRLGEPMGGITLWDSAENAPVYVWADAYSGKTPSGVRETGADQAYQVTFEAPDTGEDLVTFTMEDLSVVSGAMRARHFHYGDASRTKWMGWSNNGVDWNWQDAMDAFELETQPVSVKIAVGRDFVIASVTPSEGDPMWFVAKIP
ncbi:hypothetical protein [Candidatus Poriferisodalis sp.]|uniref:hypothetical protein n=1 Tax=Candidatus Poriferisodalis sp. TaxID=3101277 RepID=UPI003AF449E6